jgi:hypothetical protein
LMRCTRSWTSMKPVNPAAKKTTIKPNFGRMQRPQPWGQRDEIYTFRIYFFSCVVTCYFLKEVHVDLLKGNVAPVWNSLKVVWIDAYVDVSGKGWWFRDFT